MADQHYTFTGDGDTPDDFHHLGRYSQLTIGSTDAENFGGGTLLIQKRTLNGKVHSIRQITSTQFAKMQDKTIRMELPDGTRVTVNLRSSTNPNLYIEHRNQWDGGRPL